MIWTYLYRYKATLSYLAVIIILAKLFAFPPTLYIAGEMFPPFDVMVGSVYVFRNLSQREIGHWVLLAMALAGTLSYLLSEVSNATTIAFICGELTDLILFTYLSGTILQRVFWAAIISSPVDSVIFLYAMDRLNWVTFTVTTCGKIVGVTILVLIWQHYYQSKRG